MAEWNQDEDQTEMSETDREGLEFAKARFLASMAHNEKVLEAEGRHHFTRNWLWAAVWFFGISMATFTILSVVQTIATVVSGPR